ncbi:MAG: MotE family protein [Alphaproteobacteria bacterium]
MTLRLIPILIFAAVLLLGLRVGALWDGLTAAETGLGVASSLAKPAEGAKSEVGDRDAGDKAPAVDKKSAVDEKKDGKQSAKVRAIKTDPVLFTKSEIKLLQDLANRRAALDVRDKALDERAGILKAVEDRIDIKMAALKETQALIKVLLSEYDEKEAQKIRSLVKIYEGMKPKAAARIFDKLEMTVLLRVVAGMKSNKSAPVLAAMDADLARTVTLELAERARLPETVAGR